MCGNPGPHRRRALGAVARANIRVGRPVRQAGVREGHGRDGPALGRGATRPSPRIPPRRLAGDACLRRRPAGAGLLTSAGAMPFYRLKFLNHLKSLRPALGATGAQAFIDPFTLVLRLRRGEETRVLYPQFLRSPEGKNQYTHAFEVDALRFIGWYPNARHRWPLASDKLLFKRFAVENSILTPEYSTDPAAVIRDVLVKRSVSSFSF